MEQIDILLASYNGEKYIKEQIKSILNQTYKDFRLIISDDKSTDNTLEIIKELCNEDNRIILYEQEQNLGYVKNFEFLMKKVNNKIFMFSDQDDIWLENKIEESYKCLKEKNVDLVYGDLEVVNENLETMYPSFAKYRNTYNKSKKYNDYRAVFLYNTVTGCTIMCKSEYINKILPLPVSKYMPHDYWVSLIVSMNGKIYFMEDKYIKYRQHSGNQIGSIKTTDSYKNFDDVRKLFVDVKINIFKTYIQNSKSFPKELQDLSKKALEYFTMIEKKKNINFKGWTVFNKLYKYDNIKYYIINFIIMNIPFLGKILYKFKR